MKHTLISSAIAAFLSLDFLSATVLHFTLSDGIPQYNITSIQESKFDLALQGGPGWIFEVDTPTEVFGFTSDLLIVPSPEVAVNITHNDTVIFGLDSLTLGFVDGYGFWTDVQADHSDVTITGNFDDGSMQTMFIEDVRDAQTHAIGWEGLNSLDISGSVYFGVDDITLTAVPEVNSSIMILFAFFGMCFNRSR